MMALLAASLVLLAFLLAGEGGRGRLLRLFDSTSVRPDHAPARMSGVDDADGARDARPPRVPALAAALLAGVAVLVLIGGPVGWLLGPVMAVVTARVLVSAEPAAVRERRLRMEQDLPMTIDVFAACLSAGASPERALRAIAAGDDGPLARRFAVVAEQLENGADPREAWAAPPPEPRVAGLAFFERAMARAADSGIPLVAVLDRLAADVRAERRAAADQRARSVGVRAAAPLGLCFLPAFVLVGIVPMVAASLGRVL